MVPRSRHSESNRRVVQHAGCEQVGGGPIVVRARTVPVSWSQNLRYPTVVVRQLHGVSDSGQEHDAIVRDIQRDRREYTSNPAADIASLSSESRVERVISVGEQPRTWAFGTTLAVSLALSFSS